MSDQFDVLRLVTQRLEAAGIPYMLSGSVAMSVYAQPRMTRDIDLVAELSSRDVSRLTALFAGEFYLDEETVAEETRRQGMFKSISSSVRMIRIESRNSVGGADCASTISTCGSSRRRT